MHIRKQRGFNLVELVMVMVIMSIVSVVISKLLFQGYQSFITANNINQADWEAWLAIQRISKDIHRIEDATAIATIQANQFSFTDVSGSTVTYQLSGTSILRNGQVLADSINSLSFAYLDTAGNTTSTASQVKYITVTVGATQNNITTSLTTMVGTRFLA